MSQRLHKFNQFIHRTGGRNNKGVTTVFHRGGGNRKLYRIIDFKRCLFGSQGIVKKIEYDPNRTSKIALVCYQTGILAYILAPRHLAVGDRICSGPDSAPIATGNALPISDIPIGTTVHNVEFKPGRGGQLTRAAGTYAKIIKKDKYHVLVRLHSGKLYSISTQSMATIGVVSCGDSDGKKMTKAGQSR
jgi:large subunit ribosomal protein L2